VANVAGEVDGRHTTAADLSLDEVSVGDWSGQACGCGHEDDAESNGTNVAFGTISASALAKGLLLQSQHFAASQKTNCLV
jgi:hypothetical protein